MTTHLPAAAALLLALTLAGCAADETAAPAADETSAAAIATDPTEAATPSADAMAKDGSDQGEDVDAAMPATGAWIDRAAYEADAAAYHEAGDVVLFFNASWCPSCRETVKNLDAVGAPAGLTVVSVDFDTSSDLKQQYGVTVQHTFVQVDADGAELAKFTGSVTGEEIAARTA